jgi:glycerol-3-phosphate dehydrogenase
MEDVIIIGAGAVGAFVARNLSRYKASVLVLEEQNDVGDVTSMANSAIVHSGYDPVPGTKKAYFNVKGNAMFPKLCEELDVEFEQNGSLTVALDDKQFAMLEGLQERAKENGVPTRLVLTEELLKMEPNLNPCVKGALFCPTAGIVNPFTLTAHAFENALDNGVKLRLGEKVVDIKEKDGVYSVKTTKGEYQAKMVVDCAGLHSAEIASMVEPVEWKVNARKGQYYVLDHFKPGFVNSVLFPLPSEKGKGILVSKTTSGNYIVGPSSEWNEDLDDFSTDAATLANVREQATAMVPGIPFREQIRVFAGNRATPSTHDFIIEPLPHHPGFICCGGIESPGLVSSPAIGEHVVEQLIAPFLKLEEKKQWEPCVRKHIRIASLPMEERNRLIKENPHYGIMVCNCEKVSLGELEDELNRSLPCLTIKAMKKRTRAGFGKCQGGFCQPKVLLLLAKKLGIDPTEVKYDRDHSEVLEGRSK